MGKRPPKRTKTTNLNVEVRKEDHIEEHKPQPLKRVQRINQTNVNREEKAEILEAASTLRKRKANTANGVVSEGEEAIPAETKLIVRKRRKATEEEIVEAEEKTNEKESASHKTKRKRKTKEEKDVEAMPLAARSNGLRMFIGAHVSAAKG